MRNFKGSAKTKTLYLSGAALGCFEDIMKIHGLSSKISRIFRQKPQGSLGISGAFIAIPAAIYRSVKGPGRKVPQRVFLERLWVRPVMEHKCCQNAQALLKSGAAVLQKGLGEGAHCPRGCRPGGPDHRACPVAGQRFESPARSKSSQGRHPGALGGLVRHLGSTVAVCPGSRRAQEARAVAASEVEPQLCRPGSPRAPHRQRMPLP